MVEQLLGLVSENLIEMLSGVLVMLFGVAIAMARSIIKKAPGFVKSFAENLAEKAAQTPGAADDVAAKLLLAVAAALAAALEEDGKK